MAFRWVLVDPKAAVVGRSVRGFGIVGVADSDPSLSEDTKCRTISERKLSPGKYKYVKINIPNHLMRTR